MMHYELNIREWVRYLLVGISTTLVNIGIFHFFLAIGFDYRIANLFAVVYCKVYGYVANKIVVFRSHTDSVKNLLFEIGRYVLGRGVTGMIDYFGLLIAVEFFNQDKVIFKYIVSAVVIVLNYVFGKYVIFRRRDAEIQ